MTRRWQTLAKLETSEGTLELRRRGEDQFLMVIAGRVLMTSDARRSEEALATLARERLARPAARVLVGGLGMGFTLRAALDALPATGRVVVAELHAEVLEWCRGPLAPLTRGAVLDPRVAVHITDVTRLIAAAPRGAYDAILLDLYQGPHGEGDADPLYGGAASARARAALAPGGVLAVWSEEPDARFARRLRHAGFKVETVRTGRGGRQHVIYLGRS
jgi:spermidine synthase